MTRCARLFVVLPLTLTALTACADESPLLPPAPEEAASQSVDYEGALRELRSSIEPRLTRSPGVRRLMGRLELLATGGDVGPLPTHGGGPHPTPEETLGLLWGGTFWLYENGYFADGTGSLRADRLVAMLHPIAFAFEGLTSGNSEEGVAGIEATIEWIEQREGEGLVPSFAADFLIGEANGALDQLGGPNTTTTFCLSADERSCVTAVLNSIRWELPILATRLSHDFSYSFLDGEPAEVSVLFRLATTGSFCVAPLGPPVDSIWTAPVLPEPASTLFPCEPDGIIRGFLWDGIEIRDSQGMVTASCSRSAGDPCWEPTGGGVL